MATQLRRARPAYLPRVRHRICLVFPLALRACSLPFLSLSSASPRHSTVFPRPVHFLSSTFHCLSLALHCLSLTFHCPGWPPSTARTPSSRRSTACSPSATGARSRSGSRREERSGAERRIEERRAEQSRGGRGAANQLGRPRFTASRALQHQNVQS